MSIQENKNATACCGGIPISGLTSAHALTPALALVDGVFLMVEEEEKYAYIHMYNPTKLEVHS